MRVFEYDSLILGSQNVRLVVNTECCGILVKLDMCASEDRDVSVKTFVFMCGLLIS